MVQSVEQYRLNTYMYIEIMNVVKKEKKNHILTQLDDVVQAYTTICIHTHIHAGTRARTHTHAGARAHTHTQNTHTHTQHARAHTHKCADTNTIQTVGAKDNNTQLKCSEKCLEFVFEGKERIRVSDILGEVVPDMRTEIGERAKAMSFAVEALCV